MPFSEHLQVVVFDLDGLMFNTEVLYYDVGTELLRRRGKQLSQGLLDRMIGRKSRDALQAMIDWCDLDDDIETLQQETDEIFTGLLDDRLDTMPGLNELMDDLDGAGIPMAIATSSRRTLVEMVLGKFDLVPRFAFILTAEDVNRGKPDPEIYITAAKRHRVSPAQMMVLEDSQAGCRSAVDAGAFTVAVPDTHSRDHDFRGVAIVADTLKDPRIYEALGL